MLFVNLECAIKGKARLFMFASISDCIVLLRADLYTVSDSETQHSRRHTHYRYTYDAAGYCFSVKCNAHYDELTEPELIKLKKKALN